MPTNAARIVVERTETARNKDSEYTVRIYNNMEKPFKDTVSHNWSNR